MPSPTIPPTGVVTVRGWSVKPWFSRRQHVWLIQCDRYDPDCGGWLRGWLTNPQTHQLQTFPSMDAAQEAALAFCAGPDATQWCATHGVL
ncbi:hypothetical protein [Sulfobacillus thermosulfidooxidans]|uniref:hypothetical protein n=1 Tax=Sulfobacillus thermosulfidooxidans TaxID=28034 RepID=UPI0002EF49F8|nr:hypothetical protein [Sulfobacillus thermosulfidooxidans]